MRAFLLASLLTLAATMPAFALPPVVLSELERARLPPDALVAWVAEVGSTSGPPRLAYRAEQPVNPASLMKLYTTGAALELLGPAWTWRTPVLATGTVADEVLSGDLVIQGRGDPTLTLERAWLLLRQLRQRGIAEVQGDIVLDNSAFMLAPTDAGDFDGERHRPYNVQPDALLLNYKSITLNFVPDPQRGIARVSVDAPLAGVQIDTQVVLRGGHCGDWRGALQATVDDPKHLRFAGRYPASCGERSWPLAYADPHSYNARLIEGLWREIGGKLGGRVRTGPSPANAALLFELSSAPLASVVRDINKFSNNVMAQQLFLTLALEAPASPDCCSQQAYAPSDTASMSRKRIKALVREQTGCPDEALTLDNGSGLSRDSRSSARCLGTWLQALWARPTMPELVSSLPVAGIDGTAQRPGRIWGNAYGRAHLKTGSLRDAMGLAGYVLGVSGRRWAFVAIVNHPNADAARPVLDALVQWTAEDAGP